MNIKNLRLLGFKSFCTETEIRFHKGLNAIVGPNGCGKSNISDALKWIMGEQNVRNLRGERLEDIIFAGSGEHKPLGMAEVTMTIETNGGGLPAQFCQCAEVEITRRVFRSGESEYFINKQPCLLKDIREIFMDTGLNPRAYAIIEQGSVHEIISSSPQDLRKLLEEAAGITKYRERKAATLRKIEHTKDNLNRVNDIILEVQRQVRVAHRQANEAKKFVIFQKELARMEASLYYRQHQEIQERLREATASLEVLNRDSEDVRVSMAVSDASVEEKKLELLALEKDLGHAQETYYRTAGRLEVTENQIRHLEERLHEYQNASAKAAENIEELESRRRDQEKEKSRLETDLEAVNASLAESEPLLRECRRRDDDYKASLDERRVRQSQSRRDIQGLLQEKKAHLEIISTLEARVRGDEQVATASTIETGRLQAREEEIKARLSAVQLELEDNQSLQGTAAASLEAMAAELAEAEAVAQRLTQSVEELVRRLTEVQGRLDYLRQVQRDGANLKDSARALMRLASGGGSTAGFLGVMGHLIQVEPAYRPAIEAALADRLEAAVVRDESAAASLCRDLKTAGVGGATLALASPLRQRPSHKPPGDTLGPAWRFIRAESSVQALVREILNDVHLVPDLKTALDLSKSGDNGTVYCTLDGDLVYPWGGITIGRAASPQGILVTAEEITGLETEAADISRFLAERERELSGRREDLAALRGGKISKEHDLLGWKRREETLRGDMAALERELGETAARLNELEADIGRRHLQRQAESEELERRRQKLASVEARQTELNAALEKYEAESSQAQDDYHQLLSRIYEMEASRAAALEKGRSVEESLGRLLKDLRASDRLAEELAAGLEEYRNGSSEAVRALREQREQVARLTERQAEAARLVEELQKNHRAAQAVMHQKTEELKAERARWEDLSRRISAVSVTAAELNVRREEVARRASDDTGFDFSEESLTNLKDYLERAVEEVTARAQRLKSRMAKIGPVNMAAIEEVKQLEERFTFLTAQKEDLEKAVESLQQAIRTINKTSREKFSETFEKVNAKFGETFRVLFNGGDAYLQLEEGLDLLEAGVNIYAQPPGKKMAKMNLLSGGEKAMTALSLVMALFAVRPSPFCLMDEVDAPLDEVNIERFMKLINTAINGSQVVLITHNKRTMEKVDNLVGVTMESPGISKLVSVRLSRN